MSSAMMEPESNDDPFESDEDSKDMAINQSQENSLKETDKKENEPESVASNGLESSLATSFADISIEKTIEPDQLLQIISEMPNREASIAILNTVGQRKCSTKKKNYVKNVFLAGRR